MSRYLWFVNAINALLVLALIVSIRRSRMHVEHAASWLTALFLFSLFTLPSRLLAAFSQTFGLSPEAAVGFVLTLFLAVVCFHYGTVVSRLRDDNTALAQRLALLELQIEQMRKP